MVFQEIQFDSRVEETAVATMTHRRPTIIDHLIPRTDLLRESHLAAHHRAGGRASFLEQQVVRRRVTRWERVPTRIEIELTCNQGHKKGATAGSEEANNNKRGILVGSEEVTRAKDLRAPEGLQVQARHLVLPDTTALDLGQPGGAEAVHKYMTSDGDDDGFVTFDGLIDSSDPSSTDSSSTYTPLKS